jgi:hypothetical protein
MLCKYRTKVQHISLHLARARRFATHLSEASHESSVAPGARGAVAFVRAKFAGAFVLHQAELLMHYMEALPVRKGARDRGERANKPEQQPASHHLCDGIVLAL